MTRQKLNILLTIVITLCIQSACSNSDATEPPAQTASPETIAAAISEADGLFRQRADIARLRDAVNTLAKLRNPDQRNFDVEWKFAKYSYFLGQQATDQKESEKSFEKGRDAGKLASSIDPNKPDGYFWYAANLGELSRLNPVTIGIKSVNDIKGAMNKVLELKPDYQNSSAYDALAQVELETKLIGGSNQKAVEYLEKALQTEKGNADIRLHLAEAYLAVKKDKEARNQLEKVVQMTPDPEYVLEHKEAVEKAKKMLETKF